MTDERSQALRWVQDGCPPRAQWIEGIERFYGSDPRGVILKALSGNGGNRRAVSPLPDPERERLAKVCEKQAGAFYSLFPGEPDSPQNYAREVAADFRAIASYLRAPRQPAPRLVPETFVERAIRVALAFEQGTDVMVMLTAFEAFDVRRWYAERNNGAAPRQQEKV